MYLNDFQRADFYKSIGLDARQYDMQVIRKTNESASRIFPIALNVDEPKFFKYLDKCASENKKLIEIDKKEHQRIVKIIQKTPIYLSMTSNILKLFFIKPHRLV